MIGDWDRQKFTQRLRILRILAAAMAQGVVVLLGVALYIVQNRGQPVGAGANLPVVSLLAAWLLLQNTVLAIIVPRMVARSALRRIAAGTWRPPPQAKPDEYATDFAKLLAVRQTSLIIAWALLEGAGILGGLAYLVEGQPLVLVVPVLAIAFILAAFPTEGRLRLWLQEQEDRLTDYRREVEVQG